VSPKKRPPKRRRPAARPAEDAKDLRREAKAQVRANAAGLRAVSLPLDAEPAFVFRP
jgi:hypothetical protein